MPKPRNGAWHVCLIAWLLIVMASTAAWAATPKEVDNAIDKAAAYLLSKEKDGNWEAAPGGNAGGVRNPGGVTALVTYALLSAGVEAKDPHIQDAIKYLLKTKTTGTYSLGVRAQIWLALPEKMRQRSDIAQEIESEGKLLMQGHEDQNVKDGPSMVYTYLVTEKGSGDHSNSQLAVLGMWAFTQCGFETPQKYWEAVDHGWRAVQYKSGAWHYPTANYSQSGAKGPATEPNAEFDPRVSMTMAGVATLYITDDFLRGMEGIDCNGNIIDPNIEAGLKYVADHFPEIYNHNDPPYNFYAASRIGVASGLKYFGKVDWFKEISDHLVKTQNADGNWGSSVGRTSFCLLCMVKGRAPVVVNKLQYELNMHGDKHRDANWNQRPRDAANVVKWIAKENETLLNWQVVSLSAPEEDLHDAPILYIAGNQALDFTDAEINKLRQYVEEGGLIYANADCDSTTFSGAFKKVCRKLFPDYEFRQLPVDSPIYTNQQFPRNKWKSHLDVEALSNGARELVLLVPLRDPARYWQAQAFAGHEEMAALFDDIFLYTVARGEKGGLGLVHKGDTYVVQPDPKIQATKTIKVARLQYAGNWDPEPGAWRRFKAIMHNNDATDLDVQTVKLGDGKLDNSFKVAALTGTFKFSLPESEREEIRKYVEGGGTLIIDACGGSGPFTTSATNELSAIFPDAKLPEQPLTLDNPVYAAGAKMTRVEYRPAARHIVGSLHTPRIRDIEIKGRPAVFFSAEDLTCGLVGMPVDGIYGYDPDSAVALMEKLVLLAGK